MILGGGFGRAYAALYLEKRLAADPNIEIALIAKRLSTSARRLSRGRSMLVKAPAKLLSAGADALKVETYQGDDLRLKRIPNSVDTLAPNNRFVKRSTRSRSRRTFLITRSSSTNPAYPGIFPAKKRAATSWRCSVIPRPPRRRGALGS